MSVAETHAQPSRRSDVPRARIELRCESCGYGIVVSSPPVRCPMCQTPRWIPGDPRPVMRPSQLES
jgi:rubrerythrin